MFQDLYNYHASNIQNFKHTFRRDAIDEIDWFEKMLAIQGARGVGKTTLMFQHIKETFGNSPKVLYISMDSLLMADYTIYQIAEYHNNHGGTHLYIDEVHKYNNWSQELKNIYDTFHDLKVVFSSSSILQIYKGYADLSRRVVTYKLAGLSLREYIQIETGMKFSKLSFKDIIENHVELTSEILKQTKPLAYFNEYLRYGYYPFYLQGKKNYNLKLNGILNLILEVDLPYIMEINIHNVSKIKRLLKVIAGSVPFQPKITKLTEAVDLNRNTLTQYLYYLEEAEMINLLNFPDKVYGNMTKPEKIFLQNPNLSYAIGPEAVNTGTLRELFFLNQLRYSEQVNYTLSGDFLINEKYTFEVGGPRKTFKQIADMENSFLAIDELEIGHKSRIPLWLFGFLY